MSISFSSTLTVRPIFLSIASTKSKSQSCAKVPPHKAHMPSFTKAGVLGMTLTTLVFSSLFSIVNVVTPAKIEITSLF